MAYSHIYIYTYIQYIGSKPLTSTEMLISMHPVTDANSPSDRCHRRQCSRLPTLLTELGSPSSCASVQTSLVPISEGYGSKPRYLNGTQSHSWYSWMVFPSVIWFWPIPRWSGNNGATCCSKTLLEKKSCQRPAVANSHCPTTSSFEMMQQLPHF